MVEGCTLDATQHGFNGIPGGQVSHKFYPNRLADGKHGDTRMIQSLKHVRDKIKLFSYAVHWGEGGRDGLGDGEDGVNEKDNPICTMNGKACEFGRSMVRLD